MIGNLLFRIPQLRWLWVLLYTPAGRELLMTWTPIWYLRKALASYWAVTALWWAGISCWVAAWTVHGPWLRWLLAMAGAALAAPMLAENVLAVAAMRRRRRAR